MTAVVQLTREEALSRAKIGLMNRPNTSFFVALCFFMKHIWDDSQPTAYARMDKQVIGWNTQFFMELDPEERIFLMMHETMHIAYMHPARIGDRKWEVWIQACDHAINLMLIEKGFKMPRGKHEGLADPRFTGMSAEQIYDILIKECRPTPPNLIIDMGEEEGDGQGRISQETKDKIERLLVRAALQSKISGDKPGTIPGDIELLLDRITNPRLPWHRILAKFFEDFCKNDYSMRRPNRRFLPDHYMPTLWSNSLQELPFWFDMSASISDDDVKTFAGELSGVIKNLRPKKLLLGQFDTRIKSIDVVKTIDEMKKVDFRGRGGTDITPVLQWIVDNKPRCTVIFTDGEFYWPDIVPKTQVVWLIHDNPDFTAPFGKVIHYEMQH